MARAKSRPAERERRSPTPAGARKRTAIHHLKAAVAEDRIHLLYQPVVSAGDRSSGARLSHLPLHGVKVPGTFVERLRDEKRCQAIVARVIDLAHDS